MQSFESNVEQFEKIHFFKNPKPKIPKKTTNRNEPTINRAPKQENTHRNSNRNRNQSNSNR